MVARDELRSWKNRAFRAISLSFLALVVMLPSVSLADETDDDRKEAERLFNEGREAVKAEDYKTACPKFEASLKLARRAGTLFNLAQCEEHEGRLVTAVQYYKEGIVVLEPGDPRLAPSKKQLANIEPRMPYLTVNVEGTLPAGGRLTLDGREIDVIGKEFAVNPGKHELRALAPKYADGVVEFEIEEFKKETKAISIGARLPDPPAQVRFKDLGPKRIATIAAFGVGGLGVIGAAVTGGFLVSRKSLVDEHCKGGICDSPDAFLKAQQGKPLLIANTIAWGLGIAGAGAGTFLLLYKGKKEPSEPKSARTWLLGPGFVGIEGTF